MYIIIENECIDTSLFHKVKLYKEIGIIAFCYKHEDINKDIELPITFDDTFSAELAFDNITEHYEECDIVCHIEARASIPLGLLHKMKRRMVIDDTEQKEITLNFGLNVQSK